MVASFQVKLDCVAKKEHVMQNSKRILLTTPYEAFRGQAADFDPNLETCHHFNGLYRGLEKDNDDIAFFRDAARLAGIVREREIHHVLAGQEFVEYLVSKGHEALACLEQADRAA